MSKKPQARINSAAAINKVANNFNNTWNQYNGDAVKIHISGGNAKLGSIMNISLPPVVTCHNCGSCSKYCYAVRSYNRFTGTAVHETIVHSCPRLIADCVAWHIENKIGVTVPF